MTKKTQVLGILHEMNVIHRAHINAMQSWKFGNLSLSFDGHVV